MPYVISVDTGGTFTDTVVVAGDGSRVTGKAPTTPDDPVAGILDSLTDAADALGTSLEAVLEDAAVLFHGTTLTTNTVLERTGSEVGLLTTKGHGDALHIGRATSRTTGLSEFEMQHYAGQSKPDPIVEKRNVAELDERVDYKGAEVVDLDEDGAREAIADLSDEVESIALNLLWSFENAEHEQRVAEIAEEVAPETPVYASHEVAPRLGEYERGATTAINAYTAPVLEGYLDELTDELTAHGLDAPVYLMKSTGGAMPLSEARTQAVGTIMSGPTGGVIGSQFVGDVVDRGNLICTDVGGTSFDVGLVIDGEIQTTPTTEVNQYTLYQLSVDVDSIGSGGGSVARVDAGGALRVGPESAGADPGPACYGQGGERPTVTDADLILGYIDPDAFLGGRRELDVEAAREAMREHVAEPLDMTVEEAAAGVFEIVNGEMADLLRQMTIERGHDPREFSVLAYGGAGPLHASFYADDLNAEYVVVPLGDTASVFSAFGIASSNLSFVEEAATPGVAPLDPETVTAAFEREEADVADRLDEQGIDPDGVTMEREMDLRYAGQVHQVSVDVPNGKLDREALDGVLAAWEDRYETLYGEGSTYADADIELVNSRVIASAATTDPELAPVSEAADPHAGTREVYWPNPGSFVETDIYEGVNFSPGDTAAGPAVVQFPDTTVTVRPHQTLSVDDYRNFVIQEL